MVTSAILDVRREQTWEPARLLAGVFHWPIEAPTVALRDLFARLAPTSFADVGTPVITPGSIDPVLGGVRRRSRKYQGTAYQVGAELRPGDVLVPRSPGGIVMLVSDRMAGALVSSSFYALRPVDETSGLWVWGVLNCLSGRELRGSLAFGSASMALSLGELLDLPVPVPPLAEQRSLIGVLRELEALTRIPEEEATETWWRTVDLRGAEWRLMLASPRPELLHDGVPLRDFCGEIEKGRPLRDVAVESEELGLLPVADIGVLSGNRPRRWVSDTDRLARVHIGDLCVAAVGERAHAAVAQVDAAADPNVFVLRLRNPALGPAMAQYLNGQEGFALRRMMVSGSVIPHLRRGDLERLPVREEALERLDLAEAPVAPLAERLEHALWSR
jgi:hypothetical protein